MEAIELIKSIELFKGLDDTNLEKLANFSNSKTVAKDVMLFSEGDLSNSMYIIKNGEVDISVYNPDVDREMTLATLQTGDHFGELSLFDGKPRSATVKTRVPCDLVVLSQSAIFNLIAHNPAFATNVIGYLCNKIRFITEVAQDLAVLDAYRRLRKMVYRLAEGDENGQLQTKLRLDQSEMASRLGCSREMINKICRELEKGGYITYQRDTITVHKKLPPAR